LISGSGDTSFTVDATRKGLSQKGSDLYVGDKVIVSENVGGTKYIAQGTVSSVNESTGAVTISSWDSGGTFPGSGFTANADLYKWQREYMDIRGPLDGHMDAITNFNLKFTNGSEGRNVWLDDLRYTTGYLSDGTASGNILSTPQQFVQYRGVFTTYDSFVTPYLGSVTLNYSSGPTNNQLMRHGKWFNNGAEQPYFWVN
jgi:hypothetical protein